MKRFSRSQEFHNVESDDMDMPKMVTPIPIDHKREALVLEQLTSMLIPIPLGKFPNQYANALKRLAYFYDLRTIVIQNLKDNGNDEEAINLNDTVININILIQEYHKNTDI
jgi:hypothetical protein